MERKKTMWAILHTASDSWDRGHANLTLYWAEHEARLHCPNDSFRPVMVTVVQAWAAPAPTIVLENVTVYNNDGHTSEPSPAPTKSEEPTPGSIEDKLKRHDEAMKRDVDPY